MPKRLDKFSGSRLRSSTSTPPSGSAAIAASARSIIPARLKEAIERIGPVFAQFYGQAEAPMVLTYPRWLPGEHSPNGMIDKVAGLIVRGDGARIEWTRDPVDMFPFHIDPKGAKSIEVEFQFLSPLSTKEGRVVMTPEMLNAQWISLALYPAGYCTRGIRIASAIKLPQGWRFATALETDHVDGQWTHFKSTTFETFADSPLIAGKHFKQIDLDPGAARPVRFNVIADSPDELEMTPQQIEAHRNLVRQADRNFGSRHYDHYDFLHSLSDKMGGTGLEHHQSSENGTSFKYFTDWENGVAERDLLAHEYTHSWNGKFRRGADLWTPTFNTPMRNSLLWMYEGQTQYWGFVLGARSGLMSKQEALDAFAETAAEYDHMRGRVWKALIDTTNDPIVDDNRTLGWPSWQRYEDYYSEGQLVWLDADTLIRERSGGKRSLSDFARQFFGVYDGSFIPQTYTFADVVKALNVVEPYDWATFLKTRLDGHGPGAPLDGVTRGGYRLVYTDVQSSYGKSMDGLHETTDLMYSLGLAVNHEGLLTNVQWEGPAFKSGLSMDSQLIAVNGVGFTPDILKAAVKAAKGGTEPIELLVKSHNHYRTARIDWHEGLKYPHLERVSKGKASLDAILEPLP
jgi:predicted metalloprotease with PDZ domain